MRDEHEHEATADEWEVADVAEAGIDAEWPTPEEAEEEKARRLMLESGIDVRPYWEGHEL